MKIRSLYFVLVRAIGPLYIFFKTKYEGTADTNWVSQNYTGVSESAQRILRMC